MGIVNYTYNRSTSGGEIITHLINSTDGQGLHLDTAPGYIDLTNAAAVEFGTSDFSIEFILEQDSASVDENYYWSSHISGDNRAFLFYDKDGSGTLKISFRTTSNTHYDLGYDVAANFGKPTHYAVTADRSGLATLYVNGNSVATVNISGSSAVDIGSGNSTVGRIGSSAETTTTLGTFYRFRTWNRALEASDVTALFENASVPFADQYGSETVLIGVATGLDGWDADNTWNSQTTGGSNMILSATALNQNCRTNVTLGVGKKYRLTYTATGTTTAYFGGFWGGGFTNIHQISDGTRTVDFTFEFSEPFVGGNYFYCYAGGATAGVTLSNLSLVEIGCAVDLDLAFANPTQSNQVQDRAGNADGIKKPDAAGGVVQVTGIPQLNATAARIGTSAATPADGEMMADSVKVNPGASGSGEVTIDSASAYEAKVIFAEGGSNKWSVGNDGDGGDAFVVGTGGNLSTPKVTIDSAGDVSIGTGTISGGDLGIFRSENTVYDASQASHQRDEGATLLIHNDSTTTGSFAQVVLRNRSTSTGGCRIVSVEDGADASDLAFVTGDTGEKMRIDAAGNVGIGVAAPLAVIDARPAALAAALGSPDVMLGGGVGGLGKYATIGFGWRSASANKSPAEIGYVSTDTAAGTKGDLVFATRDTTGTTDVPVERMRIDAAGKSTFTTAGAISAVFQSTNASYGAIQLNNTATGGDNWYMMSTADSHAHGGGYFSLYNEDTTTHAIKVSPAGLATFANGIAFQSATTGAGTGTGYTLDSYEEGTWTGTLTGSTAAPTSAVTETGTYTKIGNLARIQIYFAAVDTTGATGSMQVTGLPFATITGNTYRHAGGDVVTNGLSIPNKTLAAVTSAASTVLTFYSGADNAGWADVQITAGTPKYMRLGLTYLTD